MADTILELKGIRKSFFGTEVLHGIDLSLRRGSVHGIVGENGAGKSTLMNVIGGVFRPDSGEMLVDGQSYSPQSPKDAQNAKIAFVHQELNLFSNLTVAENLFIENLPTGACRQVQYKYMAQETTRYLEQFRIHVNPRAKVESLSMGVRQSIEIAKALIIQARIIIFDEPTTSLTKVEKDNLFRIIDELKSSGVTIIYISHILEDVLELCDEITVIRDGSTIDHVPAKETTRDDLIGMMVGRKLEKIYPTVDKQLGEQILSCEHISSGAMVADASLELRCGEILGVFGLMGAGRTELMRAIFGLDAVSGGTITYKGRDFTAHTPLQAIRAGFAFVTEDRRNEGLLMPKSVEDNLLLVRLPAIANRLGVVNTAEGGRLSDASIAALRTKVQNKRTQLVCNLSGGNQQKVVFGKWIMNEPEVLILDEPTRGVDVGAKYEIYTIINKLAQQRSAILVVSSEMEELMGICDRILVMSRGKITGVCSREEFDQNRIMEMALAGGEDA